jgi:hypothetical protein
MTVDALTLAPLFVPPSPIDLDRSRALARLIDGRSGECFQNALSALSSEPGAMYVEGLAVSDSVLMEPEEHGWLQRADGTIVDPTPCYCRDSDAAVRYFPMFFWTADEVMTRFLRDGDIELPMRLALPHQGYRHLAYRDAKLLAYRHIAAVYEEAGVRMFEGDEQQFLRAVLGRYWYPKPRHVETVPAVDSTEACELKAR